MLKLKEALDLDIPYDPRPPLTGPTRAEAAVLALLGRDHHDRHHLLVTRRTDLVETHKGQMAFPGGIRDPQDLDLERTALRETHEELGIEPHQVQVHGVLPLMLIPTSRFMVTPFVGTLVPRVEELELRMSSHEISMAAWIPLDDLASPAIYRIEMMELSGIRFRTHVFQVGENRIWGATGAMIRNLLDRLHAVGQA